MARAESDTQSKNRNRVAIMQPTYLPWSGYFGLMDAVDIFVLLDSVQFARRSWQQRNRIKTATGELLLSIPVLTKGRFDQSIKEVTIDYSREFPEAHIRAMELNYSKAPYFHEYAPFLFDTLRKKHELLPILTVALMTWLRDTLGISTPFMLASEIEQKGAKAELLATICANLHATEYISPPGSEEYLNESDSFLKHSIPVSYFEFEHPTYDQLFGDFISHLSVIDLLFNKGPESLSIIRSGIKKTRPAKTRS